MLTNSSADYAAASAAAYAFPGRPTVSSPRHMSRGSIVIFTSLASQGTFLGVGNYVAAKHAVKGLVQTAGELAIPCD